MLFQKLYHLSLAASAALFLLLIILTVGLIASKSVRQLWAWYVRRRQGALQLSLYHELNSDTAAPERARWAPWDRPIVEDCLIMLARQVSGATLEKVCAMFERYGFADREIRRLSGRNWWVRTRAAQQLGNMMVSKSASDLVLALDDRAVEVRLMAAWALGRLGDWPAIMRIIESLAHDSKMAGLRVSSIVRLIGPAALPMLERLLKHPDNEVRLLALNCIGLLKDESALPLIFPFLAAPGVDFRVSACQAIGMIGSPAGVASLLVALKDEAWPVRARAALVLGRLKSPEAAIPLARSLTDKAWWVRFNAGQALSELGESGRRALRGALQDSDAFARDMAAQSLAELEEADKHGTLAPRS